MLILFTAKCLMVHPLIGHYQDLVHILIIFKYIVANYVNIQLFLMIQYKIRYYKTIAILVLNWQLHNICIEVSLRTMKTMMVIWWLAQQLKLMSTWLKLLVSALIIISTDT